MTNLIRFTIFLLALGCINLYINYSSLNNNLEIYILNIGQGDAILIKTPLNNYILIDGGKDKSVLGELSELFPYWAKSIDVVIATHPDLDHIGGIYEVSKNYDIDHFFINRVIKESNAFDNLKLQAGNTLNYQVNYQNDFEIDGVIFDIIWPKDLNTLSSLENINDTSISMKISYKNFTFLTMGDLNDEFEIKALENCKCKDIDILKVSHHGSKTSTPEELLEITQPKISVISAGLNNSYGHPHKDILERIRKFNSAIYRTDLDGRIKIMTDGSWVKVITLKTSLSDYYRDI